MNCAPLDNLGQYDCVLIVTDHSDYDYQRIVRESQLVVDTRNASERYRQPENRTVLKPGPAGELALQARFTYSSPASGPASSS